tara:strand:+ start:229 stop:414 length:186 start_codon:yes stop_codon:yes gene_type:complete
MTLKLDKLPDRESVKITFTADADLIPFMLDASIHVDPGFKRARKELSDARPSSPPTQTKET